VNNWLDYGLSGRDAKTITTLGSLANEHVIPALGARQLRAADQACELSAEDADRWLAQKARTLSTGSL
jgi:hypothetical protein